MALGPVAAGSIKAKEAAIAAGNINNSGLMSMVPAAMPKIGMIKLVRAVFEINSVRILTAIQMAIATKNSGNFGNKNCNLSPIKPDNPEAKNPWEIAKPPPNNNKISQGIFTAVSQSNKCLFSPLSFFTAIKNMMTDISAPTVESVTKSWIPK